MPPPPPYISRNRGEPIKSCARTITYARRGGLDTHGIFHVHQNKAREHNANAMCTLNLMSGTCPKTCGNGQGALAQVFRALAHAYWPTYPNKIDQSRSFVQVHVHFIHNHFPTYGVQKLSKAEANFQLQQTVHTNVAA